MTQQILPELDLLERIRDTSCRGTFEAHLTVSAESLEARRRFEETCRRLAVKCVVIELPQGEVRSQPMTSSYHHGEVNQVAREVAALAGELRASRFAVSRVKLEAVITNEGVPADDEAAARLAAENYFEFHAKLVLSEEDNLKSLTMLCQTHEARLSRNALKRDEQGRSERFVTLRVYGVGRGRAEARFERLLGDLSAAGHSVSSRLREYTMYDSNSRMDGGWLDAPAADVKRRIESADLRAS